MDYSLLVGIHDCERSDKYGDHVYGPQDFDQAFPDGSPVEDESGGFDFNQIWKKFDEFDCQMCKFKFVHCRH